MSVNIFYNEYHPERTTSTAIASAAQVLQPARAGRIKPARLRQTSSEWEDI